MLISNSLFKRNKEGLTEYMGYSSLDDEIYKYSDYNQQSQVGQQGKYGKLGKKNQESNIKPSKITKRVLLNPNKFLNYNIYAPECCKYNGSYSTGNGCPCITPEQSQFLKNRGGNRSS